ncbi:MAG: UDP-N-acetylmuramate--L-alanine ligase, partial [Candidatus Dormibacteraceae bacterium]
IYPAGEENPGRLTAASLARLAPRVTYAADFAAARQRLESLVSDGDLILCMGAGDIWKLGHGLADEG